MALMRLKNRPQEDNQATTAMKRYLHGKTLTRELNGERTYDQWVGVYVTEDGDDNARLSEALGPA